MIHPNRTYLLIQKERRRVVENSLAILKARRQALIMEFLASARPFLLTRRQIATEYRQAIEDLQIAMARDRRHGVASIAAVSEREVRVGIEPRNILGVRYKEVILSGGVHRQPPEKRYDHGSTSPHFEEAAERFEIILENMLKFAGFESKLKRLSRDIRQISRKARVLEQRVLPGLQRTVRTAVQYISEREREDYYRLKKFKDIRGRRTG